MFLNCLKLTTKCLQRVNHSNLNCITPVIRIQKYSKWQHRRPKRIVNEEEILQYAEEAAGPNEFIGEMNPGDQVKRKKPQRKRSRGRVGVNERKLQMSSKDNLEVEEEKEESQELELDYDEVDEKNSQEMRSDDNEADKRKPLNKRLKSKPKSIKKNLHVTPDDLCLKTDGSLNFIELKETDSTLTSLMMSVRSKKTRNRNCKIILEGHRLIEDAINSGAKPEIIIFSRISDVEKLPLPNNNIKLYKVPYRTIQMWSTLVTSPGLMGFFQIPDVENKAPAPDSLPLTIICDNVRDPGNLGSILRTAAAVGCKKLITLNGCVDIWDPKVLKTAAGCHFRMPIYASKTWNDIPRLTNSASNIFVADNNTLIETEQDNAADEDTQTADNVAETQLEAESNMKMDENIVEEIEKFEEVDEVDQARQKQKRKTNYQRLIESRITKQLTSRIPVIPYYGVNYTDNENIIILGGETLGLSMEALDMVNQKYGVRINIPMTNGVDSLNTAMALGIITFEIRRQHITAKKSMES